MKGIVFTNLADMVEEGFGLAAWQSVLDNASPPSDGIYVATSTYSDQELMGLVKSASEVLDIPIQPLVRSYGKYLWSHFESHYPDFIVSHTELIEFLLSVDSVIHTEVKKLYPDSTTPDFEYDHSNPDQLIMYYRSPRKLCFLAEGLIDAAAEYFNTPHHIEHNVCMHDGADHCELKVILDRE